MLVFRELLCCDLKPKYLINTLTSVLMSSRGGMVQWAEHGLGFISRALTPSCVTFRHGQFNYSDFGFPHLSNGGDNICNVKSIKVIHMMYSI